ncbi:hypothetical protein A1O1_04782 [Capronia coronata CBS 617.96]|uniref:RapZ C-terminal domain-containing protein n=1 Tax=Capronia coronata CBS 617.96 TaxID=1182541 RepID=W9YDZ0_9EURO|nr:uncharacterized protein A1O1_04782 [Capronia coronata CBS 617.96]EXJ87855.1 hypothetical protein A1O1_04782 [Capronia coronata CBS 617.96]
MDSQPTYNLKIFSYGRSFGRMEEPSSRQQQMKYSLTDLPNPPAELRRDSTGLDLPVQTAVLATNGAEGRLKKMICSIEAKIEDMENVVSSGTETQSETQDTLVVAVACVSGKHRSVTFVEKLYQHFDEKKRQGWHVSMEHRDLAVHDSSLSPSATGGDMGVPHSSLGLPATGAVLSLDPRKQMLDEALIREKVQAMTGLDEQKGTGS